MKAKKVFENIGFERGQNPKDSMDIGLKSNLIEKIIQFDQYDTLYNDIADKEITSPIEWFGGQISNHTGTYNNIFIQQYVGEGSEGSWNLAALKRANIETLQELYNDLHEMNIKYNKNYKNS